VQYLVYLEIPYFVGVVNLAAAELKIYSAERFPMMTAVYGFPEKLWLKTVPADHPTPWDGLDARSGVTLNCYHVCTFSVDEGRDEIRAKVKPLLVLCHASRAIATRLSRSRPSMEAVALPAPVALPCGRRKGEHD
jgi:hypothetical protein